MVKSGIFSRHMKSKKVWMCLFLGLQKFEKQRGKETRKDNIHKGDTRIAEGHRRPDRKWANVWLVQTLAGTGTFPSRFLHYSQDSLSLFLFRTSHHSSATFPQSKGLVWKPQTRTGASLMRWTISSIASQSWSCKTYSHVPSCSCILKYSQTKEKTRWTFSYG